MRILFGILNSIVFILVSNNILIAQIELKNPAIYQFSPDVEKLLVFFDQDTIGYDDYYRPVNIQIIDLSTGKSQLIWKDQLTYLTDKNAIYWIDNNTIYFPDNNLVKLKSNLIEKINLPKLAVVLGFSQSLKSFLYINYDINNNKFNLFERKNENGENQNINIGIIERFYEISDAKPPIEIENWDTQNKVLFFGYGGNNYSLFQFDFNNSLLSNIARYKSDKFWDDIKFIVLNNQIFVHNKKNKELILLNDSLCRKWDDVLNSTVLNEKYLLIQKLNGIYKLNTLTFNVDQIIIDQHFLNKKLVKAKNSKLYFIEEIGKNYRDPINHNTDYMINIYQVDLNELGK